jgi:hypothetical protein
MEVQAAFSGQGSSGYSVTLGFQKLLPFSDFIVTADFAGQSAFVAAADGNLLSAFEHSKHFFNGLSLGYNHVD